MILALAPHTDDAILGAGGLIAKLVEEGNHVRIYAFSTGNTDSGSNEQEMLAASLELNVAVSIDDLPARHFESHRQEVLESIEAELDLRPKLDLLLIPGHDDHQDHRVVHTEARRVIRSRSVNTLAYEQAWNRSICPFRPTVFAPLEFRHLATKLVAVRCFPSQGHRPYTNEHYLIANALRWGVHVKATFAEAFEVIKWTI